MAKEQNHTILNPHYFEAINTLCEALSTYYKTDQEQGIRYAIVGGCANQIHTANNLNQQKLPIKNIPGLEHILRKTDDIDLAVDASDTEMMMFFNYFNSTYGQVSVSKTETKHPTLVYRYGKGGAEHITIRLNYTNSPEEFKGLQPYFMRQIDDAQEVVLTHGSAIMYASVSPMEMIVASKLTRHAPKDMIDVYNLLKSAHDNQVSFNEGSVREMLTHSGKGACISYLDDLQREVHKN